MRRQPLSGLLLTAVLAVLAAGCGSTNSSTTTTTTASTTSALATPTATSATASTTASSTAAAAGGVSGTWSGQYSGAYQGTFILTWQQTGSNLSGTIKLSSPADTLSIHGILVGGAIHFGTVGSVAITYSGSVSGSSMSGNYQVGSAAGGPWSATKTS